MIQYSDMDLEDLTPAIEKETRLLGADGLHVLLVDDGRDNQLLVSAILRKYGGKAEVQENGQLALDAIHAAAKEGITYDVS